MLQKTKRLQGSYIRKPKKKLFPNYARELIFEVENEREESEVVFCIFLVIRFHFNFLLHFTIMSGRDSNLTVIEEWDDDMEEDHMMDELVEANARRAVSLGWEASTSGGDGGGEGWSKSEI